MKNPWILLFSLLATTAHAALQSNYCTPAQAAGELVMACEDNDEFIKEGEKCLNKLEAEVKAASVSMTAGFSKNEQQQQDKKFNSALQDNSVSSATLAILIAQATQAALDVDKYKGALSLPEDADEAEVTGGNPEGYAKSIDCYGDTSKSLDGLIADINHVKKNLTDAKTIADVNAATSGIREQKVQNNNSAAPIIKRA
jgi:hypothetical protein